MKTILRTVVVVCLARLARAIIRKYEPTIVMVTGSVGKTSTKDAVAAALSTAYFLRASAKSHNSEFGVPLTIIGAKNPWNNSVRWLKVFQEALALIILPNHYPSLLVLEVGADSPGDLERILRIATPDAVVVTRLPEVPVHVEAYPNPNAVRDEEFSPAVALPPGAPLIVSSKDTHAIERAKRTQARCITVGFKEDADVHIGEPELVYKEGMPWGMKATLTTKEGKAEICAPGSLGRPQILAPAMGYALACALEVTSKDACEGLETYTPPAGRGRILAGIKGSVLVDESYNASPVAVEEALNALALVHGVRKIAVLGDMLELGRYSMQEHERIGALAATQVDLLITVGVRARAMRDAAIAAGMSELAALAANDSTEAAQVMVELVGEGDVVLVKGSQSIRTERVMEALIARPEDREKLVRQDNEWKKR